MEVDDEELDDDELLLAVDRADESDELLNDRAPEELSGSELPLGPLSL